MMQSCRGGWGPSVFDMLFGATVDRKIMTRKILNLNRRFGSRFEIALCRENFSVRNFPADQSASSRV